MKIIQVGSNEIEVNCGCYNPHILIICGECKKRGAYSRWDPEVYESCLYCAEFNNQEVKVRPRLEEECHKCNLRMKEGEEARHKRGDPGSSFCLKCSQEIGLDQYDHWPVFKVEIGHLWTVEESRAT